MDDLDYVILRLRPDKDHLVSEFALGPVSEDMLGGVLATRPVAREKLVAKSSKRTLEEILSLEKTSLSERQAADARRDPNNLVALNMPLCLIEPASRSGGNMRSGETLTSERKDAWGIREVLGSNASEFSGAGVKVAVLDTGIQCDHAAFSGITFSSKNFTSPDQKNVEDKVGHGTHCAGTIFGRDVERKRIGVARGVTNVLVGKVLDNDGRGNASALLEALKWVQSEGANIVSMSLGFDFPLLQQRLMDRGNPPMLATSKALKAYRENISLFRALIDFLTVETSDRRGMVIVAASGNESRRDENPDFEIDVSVPAAASPNIISVGAASLSPTGLKIAPFSNTNPRLCAPGVDILSASEGGGLRVDSGTSMACPHAAGVAALWWEWAETEVGRATGDFVRAKLVAECNRERFAPGLTVADRGAGMVRAPQQNSK